MARIWFITGAPSGFGLALAEKVLERGECAVRGARRTQAMQQLATRRPHQVEDLPFRVPHLGQDFLGRYSPRSITPTRKTWGPLTRRARPYCASILSRNVRRVVRSEVFPSITS